MGKQSVLTALAIPAEFDAALLLLCLILILAPYLAGHDFGILRIPEFDPRTAKRVGRIGLVALSVVLLMHVPLLPARTSERSASVPDDSAMAPPVKECVIAGVVFDPSNNQPISAASVGLHRDLSEIRQRPTQLRRGLAITGPDGRFSFDCEWVEESQFPVLLALERQDWLGIHITGPGLPRGGRWEGLNIPLRLRDVELVPLHHIGVSFTSRQRGDEWWISGEFVNNSEQSYPCIRANFRMTEPYDPTRVGKGADLGLFRVEVRDLRPHERRNYEKQLPRHVGFGLESKEECGLETAPAERARPNQ